MDSKYTSMGALNGVSKIKKKGKKLKKIIKNVENITPSELVTQVNKTSVVPTIVAKPVKNLKEQRKQLPVYAARIRILEEIKKSNNIILIGETGSGKTTQIPQLLHEARLEGFGKIAITQPRRVAAITVAMRVAEEMNTELGSIVGYCVRFEDMTSPKTKVKYMTDGMLLREAVVDPLLKAYSIVILDEAHERTVSTDVLFGIIKTAQKQRKEKNINPLKVIVMSATMDVDAFSNYFNKCPVIYLEGRTYPVTVHHTKTVYEDYQYAALCTIFQLHTSVPADQDFLVFLTGQEEIETLMHNVQQIAKETTGPQMKVCPLYAGLPANQQLVVWKEMPPGMRKIVLSTNIAEASVTIPRIKYVIDCGMVKERTWCTATGAERLRVRKCSAAAAWQRAGRAGRDAPGAVYRLYTQQDFNSRPQHNQPEIVRCPLAPTMLSLIAMRVDPATFPLIDTPPIESVRASLNLLRELGAVDNDDLNPKLTVLGRKMAAFPIDPKYSKILLSASEYNCLEEALSLIAVLSSENVFHCPMHKREEALRVKQKFTSTLGDHITLLNIFKAYVATPLKKQWCRENYFHQKNLAYACEVRQQLLNICLKFNLKLSSCGQDYDQLLKCLLSGLFTNCAWLRGGGENGNTLGGGGARYVTSSGSAAALHPTGVLHGIRPPPPIVLFSELLHTRRVYLVTASAIQPHWIHQKAPEGVHVRKPR